MGRLIGYLDQLAGTCLTLTCLSVIAIIIAYILIARNRNHEHKQWVKSLHPNSPHQED